MDLTIVIPFYNEADNITKLKEELTPVVQELALARSVELVFVDDGSTDGSLQALQPAFEDGGLAGVVKKYERHAQNRGLGAALKTGFAAAVGREIVTTDSDGTYKFSNIPKLLAQLESGADIVTASPYHPEGGVAGVPAYRLVLSQGSSMIYRVLVDWKIHTYTCLFRAYRRQVIDTISFESDGFLAGTELMVKGMLAGYRVSEFPAVLYRRAYGVSKARLIQTIRAHLGFQWKVLLHRLGLRRLVSMEASQGSHPGG